MISDLLFYHMFAAFIRSRTLLCLFPYLRLKKEIKSRRVEWKMSPIPKGGMSHKMCDTDFLHTFVKVWLN